MIPRPAVLASVPILHILHKMPSYFLCKDVRTLDGNPLDQVAWDYARHKSSYRRFCQHMSKLFSSQRAEAQIRDCTAGAVRLALAFLRPSFHDVVQDDFDIVITYLRTFALTISQWPSQSWVKGHPEVHQVVESMVLALGEELREIYCHQQQEEISRLQVIINGLQSTIRTQGSRAIPTYVDIDSDRDFEIEYEESDEPTLVTMDVPNVKKRPSFEMSISILPRMPIPFQTPITPPESPSHPFFVSSVVPTSNAIIPTSIQKSLLQSQDDKDGDRRISSSTPSELCKESSLSPLTHFSRDPLFSRPSADHLEKFEASTSSYRDETKLQEHTGDNCESVNQSSIVELEAQYNEEGNESLLSSPSIQWNPLSSRSSSIVSIDTLCETSEFPSKRFSIVSYSSNASDSIPALPIEVPLRSASFSDPWSITPGTAASSISPPCKTDPSIIPLPPSPSSLSASDSTLSSPLSSPITVRLNLTEVQSSSDSASSVISPKSRISLFRPLPIAPDEEDNHRSTTIVETASYIVTGFLVGAFITIFLFSTQRRTLLYLT